MVDQTGIESPRLKRVSGVDSSFESPSDIIYDGSTQALGVGE